MEEKKVYSVIGQVTIGTDEYRELIEGKLTAENTADDYRSKYWAEQNKVNALQKQVDALKAKIEKCEKFIKKNSITISEDGIKNAINISEEGIISFMSLFEEE